MLQLLGRVFVRWPAIQRTQLLQHAGRSLAAQGQKTVEEISDDSANFSTDAEDFGGTEADVDPRARYNFDENHIEVTGIVRGPPRVYTMPTGRQYAIVKMSTTSVDRRGSGRFVSFVDVFAPNNIVDYIKDHVREGIQVYVSGQLRSRLRTDEDGRSFQDVRVQANGLFKIVDPKHVTEENSATGRDMAGVNSETKQTTS
ncbi:single-strand binding protein family protein [Loa loa]|uniref:Single-strand binding protein family protein n=1 Tax=Loa loa TaxID=7209 RepID=A0A1I7VS15_LOALO|nr:single-strand binding protein family protein [Loa loa]EFO23057.1 single-strand binding protein family protein [Loa loa]